MKRWIGWSGIWMMVMLLLVACSNPVAEPQPTPLPENMVVFEEPNGVFTLPYPDDFNEPTDIGNLLGEQTYVMTSPDRRGALVVGIGLGSDSPSDDLWTASVSRPDLLQSIGQPLLLESWDEYSRDIDNDARTVRLEVGSEAAGMHGTIWMEESEGVMTVIVWAAPDEQSDQYQPLIEETIRGFDWSAERAREIYSAENGTEAAPDGASTPESP